MTGFRALARHGSQARQAARVTAGTALTYAAYKALGFPQGYWAIFTVIVVLQGSIATTLGAAIDRLVGTVAGALIGGLAVFAIQHGDATNGVALIVVIAVMAFAAAVRPQLKIAPITAAIMLLTQPPDVSTTSFITHRILEIALGGFIGVVVSVVIFPARSEPLVIARASAAMAKMQGLLLLLAEALERGTAVTYAGEHPALRLDLAALEQATNDAARERASGFSHGSPPPSLTRALWRIRNDLVLVGRALDEPLPEIVGGLVQPAAEFLRAEAAYLERSIAALNSGEETVAGEEGARYAVFHDAFGALREAGHLPAHDAAGAGQIFGLAFAIEILHRDVLDLGERFGKGGALSE